MRRCISLFLLLLPLSAIAEQPQECEENQRSALCQMALAEKAISEQGPFVTDPTQAARMAQLWLSAANITKAIQYAEELAKKDADAALVLMARLAIAAKETGKPSEADHLIRQMENITGNDTSNCATWHQRSYILWSTKSKLQADIVTKLPPSLPSSLQQAILWQHLVAEKASPLETLQPLLSAIKHPTIREKNLIELATAQASQLSFQTMQGWLTPEAASLPAIRRFLDETYPVLLTAQGEAERALAYIHSLPNLTAKTMAMLKLAEHHLSNQQPNSALNLMGFIRDMSTHVPADDKPSVEARIALMLHNLKREEQAKTSLETSATALASTHPAAQAKAIIHISDILKNTWPEGLDLWLGHAITSSALGQADAVPSPEAASIHHAWVHLLSSIDKHLKTKTLLPLLDTILSLKQDQLREDLLLTLADLSAPAPTTPPEADTLTSKLTNHLEDAETTAGWIILAKHAPPKNAAPFLEKAENTLSGSMRSRHPAAALAEIKTRLTTALAMAEISLGKKEAGLQRLNQRSLTPQTSNPKVFQLLAEENQWSSILSLAPAEETVTLANQSPEKAQAFAKAAASAESAEDLLPSLLIAAVTQQQWHAAKALREAIDAYDKLRWIPWHKILRQKQDAFQKALAIEEIHSKKLDQALKRSEDISSPASRASFHIHLAETQLPAAKHWNPPTMPDWLSSLQCP